LVNHILSPTILWVDENALKAADLELEDPDAEHTHEEAPRRQAHTHRVGREDTHEEPPHLSRRQRVPAYSSEDESDSEDKSQEGHSGQDEDLFTLNNKALRQTFNDEVSFTNKPC